MTGISVGPQSVVHMSIVSVALMLGLKYVTFLDKFGHHGSLSYIIPFLGHHVSSVFP